MNIRKIMLAVMVIICSVTPTYAQNSAQCPDNAAINPSDSFNANEYLLYSSGYSVPVFHLWNLHDQTVAAELPFSTFDLQSEQQGIREAETFRIPKISQNGAYISYAASYSPENLNRSIQLIWSIDEHRLISTFVWHTNWIHFIDWIGEDRLAFVTQDDNLAVEVVDMQGIVQQTFPLNELGITIPVTPFEFVRPTYDSYFLLWTTLSQQLEMVLYLRARDILNFQVFNLESPSEFYQLDHEITDWLAYGVHQVDFGRNRPAWSPNGDQLAMVLPSLRDEVWNLHILTNQGTLHQLTFFEIEDEDNVESIRVSYPVWSPDNHLIAFWFDTSGGEIPYLRELYIYDLQYLSLTNTGVAYRNSANTNIVWSPDGDYLAFSDQYENQLIIVDQSGCEVLRQSYEMGVEGGFSDVYGWFEAEE